jgi:hypothetical protein
MSDWLPAKKPKVEILPPESRDIALQRLSRYRAWLARKEMEGTTRYKHSEIAYIQAVIDQRRALIELDDVNFEREMQLERFKHKDKIFKGIEQAIITQLQKSETEMNDAKAHEAKRVIERETENLLAQVAQNQARAQLYPAPVPTRDPEPPPPVEAPPEPGSQEDREFEQETNRILEGSRKLNAFKEKWNTYAQQFGGLENMPPEDKARYEAEKQALEKILKQFHRA